MGGKSPKNAHAPCLDAFSSSASPFLSSHRHLNRIALLSPLPSCLPPLLSPSLQVAFIDVKEQTPVGHGAVTCFSIYGGPDINFNDDP